MGGLFIVIIVIAALVVDPSLIVTEQVRQALLEVILSLLQYVLIYGATLIEEMVPALWGQERCETMGTRWLETPSRSEEETSKAGVLVSFMNRNDFDLNEQPPEHEQLEQEQPRVEQQPRPSVDFHSTPAEANPFHQQLEGALFRRSMARTLAEIREKYPAPPTADDPDSNAKDAVLGMLQLNTSLNGALLFYLGSQKPFPDGVLSDPGNLPGYQDRIEQIMHSNAKNINCLEDLIELKLRLESQDSRQINATLETWKDRYATKNRTKTF